MTIRASARESERTMYDTHYGLTGRPFGLTPDPRFWFDTATHRKAMAYLGYGLSQSEGFIVITGDIGAGKTTLVGHLMAIADRDALNIVRIVSTQIEPDDLLRVVLTGMGIEPQGLAKAEMLRAIERGLHAAARAGKRTLLIADEAQALPVGSLEELRMLSNFQAGGHALLQIFLLGQPEFRDRLVDPRLEQLRQRVIAMHHLGPMEPSELGAYLAHRLTVVGWSGRPDFAPSAIEAMYDWSGGIPRRLNQLASRVLLHGAIEGIERFEGDDVAAVIADLDGDTGRTAAAPRTRPAPAQSEPLAPSEDDDRPLARDPVKTDREVEAPVSLHLVPDSEPREPRPIRAEGAVPPPPPPPFRQIAAADLDVAREPQVERHDVVDAASPAESTEMPPSQPALDARPDLVARIAVLEQRLEDQDAALRRVLTLLVDWVEVGGSRPDVSAARDAVGS